jgi:hypothetical protein
MRDRLSLSQGAALMAYAATTPGGQLLCSKRRRCGELAMVGSPSGPLAFCSRDIFFVALILYAALTVLWVWILSFFYPALARLSVPRACICAHASAWLPNRCRCGCDLHRAEFVWAFLHCGMSDAIADAASMDCHRCLQ